MSVADKENAGAGKLSVADKENAGAVKTGVSRWLRPTVEYAPIATFFLAYVVWGLFPATAALIGATVLGVGLALAVERRVPMMPLFTAVVVGIFGGLTLWLNDDTFIKMKPTIIQALFAIVLLVGLAMNRSFLKMLLGSALQVDDQGWRRLSLRWALFFIVMAALNEAVWRTQSTDTWVAYKVFGILGLTLVFAVAQTPLILRHRLPQDAAD